MVKKRNKKCVFCESDTVEIQHGLDYFEVDCEECGLYYIGFPSKQYIESDNQNYPKVEKILIANELKKISHESKSPIGIMDDDCYDIANLDRGIKRWKFRDLRRMIQARTIEWCVEIIPNITFILTIYKL